MSKSKIEKYPAYVLGVVRQAMGYDEYDERHDYEILTMTPNEVFEKVCQWEGLQGSFNETIKSWIKDIYKVDLNHVSARKDEITEKHLRKIRADIMRKSCINLEEKPGYFKTVDEMKVYNKGLSDAASLIQEYLETSNLEIAPESELEKLEIFL